MRIMRQVLVGKFGSEGAGVVETPSSSTVTEIDFLDKKRQLRFGIGEYMSDMLKMGVIPTEIGFDLLIVAAHVYAADTRISRQDCAQDSWTREIKLVIPVGNIELWNTVTDLLELQLNFLTGDIWIIEFSKRECALEDIYKKDTEVQPSERLDFDSLSLFSGGLDSLIGAINLLEGKHNPIFISHAGDGAVSEAQNKVVQLLRESYPERHIGRFRMWMSFPNVITKDGGSEKTTRSRSFLFIAMGIFIGLGVKGIKALEVCENGLISINVPLDSLRLGSHSTHTTHPFYMARWKELLSKLGVPLSINNPYVFMTKGEMVRECKNASLLNVLLKETISCSSPNKGRWKKIKAKHCGYCVPCLVRRAAIKQGLASADPTNYGITQLDGRELNTLKAEGQQIRAFQYALSKIEKNPTLTNTLIYSSGSLVDFSYEEKQDLAGVYARGMKEMAVLLKDVVAQPDRNN